jgi:predicted phosphodiesterase
LGAGFQAMSTKMIELCRRGRELNYSAKYRSGNLIHLPDAGKVIISGDLHGHRRNFEKIVTFADLDNNPQTYVIFQEILHGGPKDDFGGCLSFKLLFDAIDYQLQFPDQVYIILGNHDTAILCNLDIMKAGREMTRAMQATMKRNFEDEYESVYLALKQYLLSQPLAVRCANRIWASHSLPPNSYADSFDMTVFQRQSRISDMTRPNPAYLLTWGRRHSEETLAKLAKLFDVDIFILGHQPQDRGWSRSGENTIILASDHNHGCLISFDLARSYTVDELLGRIVPLASIA